jgi:hypothetical protein
MRPRLTDIAAQKTAADTCNMPVRKRGLLLPVLGPVLAGVALIFLILRIIARRPTQSDLWGLDDGIIVFAWVIGLPVAVFDPLFHKYGLGQDVWMVPVDHITRVLRLFWLAEIFYLLCTVATKLALLMFFLRVFPNRKFRIVTWTIIAACLAFCVGFIFPLIFQCRPIHYAWTRWDGEHEGSCINVYAGIFAHAAINMVLDLVILILPMPMLFKLHITYSLRQKAHIFVMFSFGLIVTIVCILRLNALVPLQSSTNPTWDYWGSAIWSVTEQEVGIICACLPAAKVVLAKLLPSWLGLTTNATASGRQTPGPYVSASSKRMSGKPSERGSVVPGQMGSDGFTELVDMPNDNRDGLKRLSTVQEVQLARSEGGTSFSDPPVSTKGWS